MGSQIDADWAQCRASGVDTVMCVGGIGGQHRGWAVSASAPLQLVGAQARTHSGLSTCSICLLPSSSCDCSVRLFYFCLCAYHQCMCLVYGHWSYTQPCTEPCLSAHVCPPPPSPQAFAEVLAGNESWSAPMDETYELLGVDPASITGLEQYLQVGFMYIFGWGGRGLWVLLSVCSSGQTCAAWTSYVSVGLSQGGYAA